MVERFDPGRYRADRWLYYEVTGDRIKDYDEEAHDTFYQGDSSDKDWGGGSGEFVANDDQNESASSRLIDGSVGKSIEPTLNWL